MGQPSDKAWETELRKSEKALRKALAMPNNTIAELLIQGAELVDAIGVKAILLTRELTEPEEGIVFEDELEARAGIATFKEACNNVLSALDEVRRFLEKQRG